ncbi:hypothetical protein B1A87_013315 [Arthrobacter sp. KBS0703]|nr:hypothetical protein B1A87_022280 [Arthrobacter sp. KBS0703]TSE16676.1 hypothetical protein B1A87_013315 [Arthrobacter sp. KBS0703]
MADRSAGTLGAAVSGGCGSVAGTVTEALLLGPDTLPAPSMAVTEYVYVPAARPWSAKRAGYGAWQDSSIARYAVASDGDVIAAGCPA